MKTTFAFVAFTILIAVAASAQDGRLQLDILDKLAARASEKQEVALDGAILNSLGQGFVGPGPKGDAAKQILAKLRGIFVRNYEFDDPKAYSMDDINALRKQLLTPPWVKVVSNEEKGRAGSPSRRSAAPGVVVEEKGRESSWELQEIYFFQTGGKTGGIVILSAEPGELSVINIVGSIDFAELGALGGVLGIPSVQTGLNK